MGLNDYSILTLENTPNNEVVYFINSADVVVLTSMHEGSPNVIKESMACNVPIVSTRVGDVKELIEGTVGCFLSNSDADDLAQKIQLALRHEGRTTGRSDIEHLRSEIVAQKLVKLYRSILN